MPCNDDLDKYFCFKHKRLTSSTFITQPARLLSGKAFASHTGDWGSIPGRDRSVIKAGTVTGPLSSARQRV